MRSADTPAFRARLTLLATDEGGRSLPLGPCTRRQCYRANLCFSDDSSVDAHAFLSLETPLEPGVTRSVIFPIFETGDAEQMGWLRPGATFRVVEGARTIARGVVEALLDAVPLPPPPAAAKPGEITIQWKDVRRCV